MTKSNKNLILFTLVGILFCVILFKIKEQNTQSISESQNSSTIQNIPLESKQKVENSATHPYRFLEKNHLQLIIPDDCTKDSNGEGPHYLCFSCDSEICKSATELYAFYLDGSVIELKGNLFKKENVFKSAQIGDSEEYEEYVGSIFEKGKIIQKRVNNYKSHDFPFVLIGKNIKTLLSQIKYLSLQKVEERKNADDKFVPKYFKCKSDTGYETVSFQLLTSEITSKKYYNKWIQKKINSDIQNDPDLYIASSGLFSEDQKCVEWYREKMIDPVEDKNSTILEILGILKLDDEFFIADVYNDYDQDMYYLEQVSANENKLIRFEY